MPSAMNRKSAWLSSLARWLNDIQSTVTSQCSHRALPAGASSALMIAEAMLVLIANRSSSAEPSAASSLPSAYVCSRGCKVIAEYLPVLHYKFHPLEFSHIIRRIAGDGNEICILAFLDRSHSVAPANIVCAHRCCGTDRLQGGHSVFDHGGELNGFFPVIRPCLFAAGARADQRVGLCYPSPTRSAKFANYAPTFRKSPFRAHCRV